MALWLLRLWWLIGFCGFVFCMAFVAVYFVLIAGEALSGHFYRDASSIEISTYFL